jgi:hypothetical protein
LLGRKRQTLAKCERCGLIIQADCEKLHNTYWAENPSL